MTNINYVMQRYIIIYVFSNNTWLYVVIYYYIFEIQERMDCYIIHDLYMKLIS